MITVSAAVPEPTACGAGGSGALPPPARLRAGEREHGAAKGASSWSELGARAGARGPRVGGGQYYAKLIGESQ